MQTLKSPLVSTDWLAEHLNDPDLVIADVRWDASAPDAAVRGYREGHIPGAVYIDLDEELSDRSDLTRGRHPLPDPQVFVKALARHGIGEGTRLVVYDDKAGSLAARLWWMMRWIGAPEATVLDGGFTKWLQEGKPIETGSDRAVALHPHPLKVNLHSELAVNFRDIERLDSDSLLLDARAPERYRGEVEPIDARAGHIPGAVNAPWAENLSNTPEQTFKSPAELRARYEALGASNNSQVICYCGSGVTACHDVLALDLAGFRNVCLYPGSWSEWVATHPD